MQFRRLFDALESLRVNGEKVAMEHQAAVKELTDCADRIQRFVDAVKVEWRTVSTLNNCISVRKGGDTTSDQFFRVKLAGNYCSTQKYQIWWCPWVAWSFWDIYHLRHEY